MSQAQPRFELGMPLFLLFTQGCLGSLTNVGAGIRRDEGHGVDSSAGTTVSIHTMTSEGHEYCDWRNCAKTI